ncbi:MAG: hypothetical protein JO083_02780 [Candidatus Eremiobacteraeota bacterium]|nr:hypothetical protein [Candidatus Eremiobacteraeota bacterium]
MRPHARIGAGLIAMLLLTAPAGAATSRYVGTYTTSRPGADSTQALTLVLDRANRVMLTTRFPDLERRYGPGVLPVRESGSWRERGATAEVHFTRIALVGTKQKARKEDKVIGFALKGCALTAVRYSKLLYGDAGLTFERAGCKR